MSLSIHPKYIQRYNANPHNPHWRGIPKGSSYYNSDCKCWLCKCGCAVLSYLFWKQLEPNEENVLACLDKDANFDWHKNGLYHSSSRPNLKIVAPCIAKLRRTQERRHDHFIFISEFKVDTTTTNCCWKSITVTTTGSFNYFDPDGCKRNYHTMKELEDDVEEIHY